MKTKRSKAALFTPKASRERVKAIYIRPDSVEVSEEFSKLAKRLGYRSANEFGVVLIKWSIQEGEKYLRRKG